ncbi:MAG: hypothetical protein ACREOO_22695 [bacterium]
MTERLGKTMLAMRNPSIHHSCLAVMRYWLVSHICLVASAGFAQIRAGAASFADSSRHSAADSSLLEWSAASSCEVLRLRVQRWLTKNQQKASLVITNVTALLQEAEGLAQSHDYVTAQLLLETALDLIETVSSSAADSPARSADSPHSRPNASPARIPARWHSQQEALLGVDLSQLEYVLGSPALDEIFADISTRSVRSAGNPFAGFRFQLLRTPNTPADLRLLAMLKTSRDYDSGTLELYARHALGPQAFLHFENDFEATAYRLETDLRYWQNAGLLRMGVSLSRNFRVEMEDELGVRRYRDENLYSPNYWQNEIGLSAAYDAGPATRLQARYDYGVRMHASFPLNDYVEHRFDASIAQHNSQNSSVLVQNLWRTRDYPSGIPDSTFQNSYQEEFLRADLRFGLSELLALRVEGDLTLRQYKTANSLTPDFFNARINPQLEHRIGNEWQVSGGYVFLLQVHGTREQQGTASASTAVLNGGFYEDYYANGFTLGLEWYSSQGVLLSVNHTYEVRTYPHDPLKDALLPSLYSDYNNHSLLLFLSWKLSAHWQMSAVANYDNQTSRTETGDDLRNTLFSVEVGYGF